MERFSIIEVIEQAVQTESMGYEFYNKMAKKFEEKERLKRLFEILAQRELVHKKNFLELKEITGEEEPDDWEEISKYLRAIVESEFFLGKGKSLPSLDERVKTIEDAIKFAIGFEKEMMLYFIGLKDAVKNKDIIEEIINEEKSHIKWLIAFH